MGQNASYLDFALRLTPNGKGGVNCIVIHAPVGGGSSSGEAPSDELSLAELNRLIEVWIDKKEKWVPKLDGGLATSRGPVAPDDFGRLLSEALLRGRVLDCFQSSRAFAVSEGHLGLRLRLLFELEENEAVARLVALPWELLAEPGTDIPLAQDRRTPVVRSLVSLVPAPRPDPITPPLKVLVVLSAPDDTPRLDLEADKRAIEASLGQVPGVKIDYLEAEEASAGNLLKKLGEGGYHVFHLSGHGGEDPATHEGCVLLYGKSGRAMKLPASVLASELSGLPALRLVFLTNCRSSRLSRLPGVSPYKAVANALMQRGMPAVVGMQYWISDVAAISFATGFYRELAAGSALETALTTGRLQILADQPLSREWITPALLLRLSSDPVLDNILSSLEATIELKAEVRDQTAYIEEKTEGFVGRRFVYDELEAFTHQADSGYFLVVGDPGIGKSALVAELVRGRRCLHHFNRRAEGVVTASAFLRNLCAQLIVNYRLEYPTLPPRADRDGGFLGELLRQVSARLGPGEKLVIAVDALDESDIDSLDAGVNALYLPNTLPKGVFLFVSSRDVDRLKFAEGLRPPLRLRHDQSENRSDIEEFVGNHLGLSGVQDFIRAQSLSESRFVDSMAERSAGNFMYLHHLLPAIGRGEYANRELSAIPTGLTSYYEEQWARLKLKDKNEWFDYGVPVLSLITVMNKPVLAEDLARYLGHTSPARVRSVLREWQQFLHCQVTPEPEGQVRKRYSLYHTSFFEFIRAKDEVKDEGVSLRAAQEQLTRALMLEDDQDEEPG